MMKYIYLFVTSPTFHTDPSRDNLPLFSFHCQLWICKRRSCPRFVPRFYSTHTTNIIVSRLENIMINSIKGYKIKTTLSCQFLRVVHRRSQVGASMVLQQNENMPMRWLIAPCRKNNMVVNCNVLIHYLLFFCFFLFVFFFLKKRMNLKLVVGSGFWRVMTGHFRSDDTH